MKIPEKTKAKKDKIKKKEKVKPKKEHVLVVAQEIKFARLLSGNEKKTRDRVLKSLKKWLLNCFEKGYEFKEDDFVRVWKGLFYAVWMSDKPLIQEELCENISAILDVFPEEHLRHALLMYKAGLRVLATEWYGLDQHRTDKFLMLVRHYLRASLRCLLRSKWSLKSCQMYAKILSGSDGIFALKTPHYARNAMSMLLHIVDCYLEEIAKVSSGDIPEASLVELLRPLCTYMCGGSAPLLCAAARRLLTALVRQSPKGLEYQHATAAWQKMGCPEGGPEALELVTDSEEDDEDEQNDDEITDTEDESTSKPLDPRAGRVDVELATLPVPASQLATLLRELLATASSTTHRRVRICLQRFEQLARDEYPLRVQTEDAEESAPPLKHKKSAQSLQQLEKKLLAASDELALRGLSRKHRKRLLAKTRAGSSIVEEVDAVKQKLSTEATSNGWQVETAEPEAKKPKQANKENKKRNNDNKVAVANKKRKVDAKANGDATDKSITVEDIAKSAKDNKNVANKLDNAKVKKNIENGEKNKAKSSKKPKDNVPKVIENGAQNNKIKTKIIPVDNKTTNGVDKANKKPQQNVEKPTQNGKNKKQENTNSPKVDNSPKNKSPALVVNNKVKQFQKQTKKTENMKSNHYDTPKKVKFALKNNSMQQPVDYYKSVRQSPSIPFDSSKQPSKTNLKPSTPSPINPFFKKKLRLKN